MPNQSNITVFLKEGELESEKMKEVLRDTGNLFFKRLDTETSLHENAVVYLSGKATIPQLFIGSYPIGGTEILERLWKSRRIRDIIHFLTEEPGINMGAYHAESLEIGAEDSHFIDYIPKSDGTSSKDPEQWPILHFYKDFFGFWPNTFVYLHHWPEVYKRFFYCHNMPTIQSAKKILGPAMLCAVGYATSNAHGCNYCQVHSVATMGDMSMTAIEQLRLARIGQREENNPFDEYWVSIADLASMATLNQVPPHYLERLHHLAPSEKNRFVVNEEIMAVALVSAAFGFLNVFNDLVGLEIEGGWAVAAEQRLQLESGRHAVNSNQNPTNLDHPLPTNGPSIDQMMKKYIKEVKDYSSYCKQHVGMLPPWIAAFPEHLRSLQAAFYSEVMTHKPNSHLTCELKHLMAYVSHIEKEHQKLAEAEAYMAHFVSSDKNRTIERIQHAFAIASHRGGNSQLFSLAEQAALQLAYVSAQMPLVTPRRFSQQIADHFDADTCIELFVVCGIASLNQRFTAIISWPQDPVILQFMNENKLERNLEILRFPLL
ncbi:hypothetical protein MUN88_07100 [Gracilibacillus caseinilyticus]|uniref:Uncharacterized protein n=1 Tax=Gracilibacillus caseinilyticus TaxID=2932256 RepID=A0ABY4F177_9BACI|nr:hypothetical protein [Gracilibacillus caseinilyticus]UOQ49833.1 hypothetical protein MUN88_07100 [Gracilibacillus caseinilyticus]